ncbi:MAG: ATP-binding protein [Ferruginibacter sp.]|nr:ATP-binding protein [Ferruginibacter sp.]
MKIHIPNSAFLGNIEAFLNTFDPANESILEVTSNQKWISVHPIVISMIVSLIEEVEWNGGEIFTQEFNAKSRAYLLRMGLIEALYPTHDIVISEHELAGRSIPARKIETSEQLNQFIADMVPLLHTTPEQAYPIKYVMSELVRNALEHSKSPCGAIVSAQYFEKTNRISIGVADRGIGIKNAINISYATENYREAIGLALRPGITGTTKKIGGTAYNAGAGLFFTKSIAKVSRDFFLLYSGNSFFKLHKTSGNKRVQLYPNPLDDKSNFRDGLPFWKGTAVGIDISMDINQDFQDLLEMIRDAYQLDVKRQNKIKYKKPKFL